MKFFIKTFGCQMNVNDSEKMAHILKTTGCRLTDDVKNADLVIINSCAVREKAQEKIYSYIGRLTNEKKIIVSGCVAQAERERIFARNSQVQFVLGTHQFYNLEKVLKDYILKGEKGLRTEFTRQWQELVPGVTARESRISGYISIMEGCNNFCSYCIVPFTRGREKNRPLKSILQEARYLAENGFSEIILLGQNVNNWRDPRTAATFPQLLERLAAEIEVRWIRFVTSYPGYYDRDIIRVMKSHSRIARHMHFPAQSGSTRILRKMNRSYTRQEYLKIVREFVREIPGITFSSDFIVGFPGESERDFLATLSLLEAVQYETVFSFVYSPRLYTRAFSYRDDIAPDSKKDRLYRLQSLQERIQIQNNRLLIGREIDVLVSGAHPKKPGEMIGRTENYRVVNFVSQARPGDFVKVLVERVGPHSLRGRHIT